MSRILLISHIFPPAIDGGSRVIYKLGQYLESQNHQTLYLSSDCSSTDDFTKSSFKKSRIMNHESKIYLSVYHHLRRPLRLLEIILNRILFINHESYILNLVRVFQKGPIFKIIPFVKATIKIVKFKPDLIIAGPLPTTTILYANFLKKVINLKGFRPFLRENTGLSGRGFCKLLINASFHPTDPDFHQKPLIKTLQSADYLWTLTQSETDYFIKNFYINPQKIILAGNGIDPNFLIKKIKNKKSPSRSFIHESSYLNHESNILFIGSFSAHKGIDLLINSFSTIYDLQPNISLTIAGQKTLFYPKIKNLIKKQPKSVQSKIKFVFNFPQNQLKKLIDQSTVLVLPSHQESFGLVLIEAWARGKPVITSNIPSLSEIVKKTNGGLIFDINKPSDLTVKINQIISNPSLSHQLGQNGFNYVKNNYTWSKVGKNICQRISLS